MGLSFFGNWLILAPLWTIAFFIFGGMIAASIAGWTLRRRRDRRLAHAQAEDDKEAGEQGIMISAIMGLLALLVAFTFSIAIDRFDTRRMNVLNEANAIGTTYLRAQLLEQPHRGRISGLLIDYTDVRIELAALRRGPEQSALLARNDQLLVDLWTATVAAFPSMRSYAFSNSFLGTMNELIDMDASRKAGRQTRVPASVFLVLFLYLFIAAGFVGYIIVGKSSRRTAFVLFCLFGVLMVLIIDMDRPTSGGVTESQEPMVQLKAFFDANPPDRFNGSNPIAPPPQLP